MSDLQAVRRFLGGKDFLTTVPKTQLDYLPALQEGFPWVTVENLYEKTGLPEQVIQAGLNIPPRTLARRKQKDRVLTSNESEAVLRFATAFVTARRVLGEDEKARQWLQRPNRSLRGKKPLDLLRHGIGYEQVIETLGRIEHGVYS